MSEIWKLLQECEQSVISVLDSISTRDRKDLVSKFHQPDNGWKNLVWKNESIRRAHLDVVDARDTKGLWMMHLCVFPNLENNSPIFGFDVIAGKNKVTGMFFDLSHTTSSDDHPIHKEFVRKNKTVQVSKERTLPEWASNIFSDSMIAAGNITNVTEAQTIIDNAVSMLKYYVEELDYYNLTSDKDKTTIAHNYYCLNQRQNPHTPKVMKNLGLNDDDVTEFCGEILFPYI